jgi:hypothetical protein
MRWLPALLSAASLLLTAVNPAVAAKSASASKRAPEERFNHFHAKSLSSTPVKLSDASYRELTAAPRDYSVAVLMTALDSRFVCQLCREFQPEWELLARSWTKGDKKGESRLLFGTLDFLDGRDIFMSVSTGFLEEMQV